MEKKLSRRPFKAESSERYRAGLQILNGPVEKKLSRHPFKVESSERYRAGLQILNVMKTKILDAVQKGYTVDDFGNVWFDKKMRRLNLDKMYYRFY